MPDAAPSTNLTISFGREGLAATDHLSAEIDSRPDGLNAGRTSFEPGDTAYFLVHKSAGVRIDRVVASVAGVVVAATAGLVTKEVDITFEDSDTARLPVPAAGLQSLAWLGTALGATALDTDGVTVRAASRGVAVGRARISTYPAAYGIRGPDQVNGLARYPILVMVYGRRAA